VASVIVRNLSDEAHRALRLRAATNGRSTEAEIRAILEEAVLPKDRLRLGSAMAALGAEIGFDLEIVRDIAPAHAVDFE
jgi:plasmid stability protein